MICPSCGKEIPDGVRFCPECGAPVSSEAPFIPAEPAYPSVPAYPSEPVQPAYTQPSAPYAPQQTYPPQQPIYTPPAYAPAQKTNGLSIAGFVCAIVGTFIPYIGVVVLIVGLILSIVGLTQIKKTGEKGRGFSIAGIIISVLSLIGAVLILVFFIALLREASPYIYDTFEDILPYIDSYMT